MKRLHVLILTLLFVAILPSIAFSREYFVAKSGNDNNPGTYAEPFLTIQKAADMVSAGDTVYIRAGTYTESPTTKASGTSGSLITFENYNSETVTISGTIVLGNYDYNKFKGLIIKNGSHGFYNNQGSAPIPDYITIENCTIQDTSSYGIYIREGTHITVKGCTIKDTGNSCINGYGGYWTVESNDISNPAIEDGVHLAGDPGYHKITKNYIHNVNGTGHVDGIQLSSGAYTIIEYNILENCRSTAIMIDDMADTTNRCNNIIIRYNLIYQTQDFAEYDNTSYRIILYHGTNCEIIGNTIAYGYLGALRLNDKTPYGNACTGIVKNNIFYKNRAINAVISGWTLDHNSYYGSSQGTAAENGDGEHSISTNPDFISDANLTSPASSYSGIIATNFMKLSSDSPCKDAGTPYSGRRWIGIDLAGKNIPTDESWDIGAYEMSESETESSPAPPSGLKILSN